MGTKLCGLCVVYVRVYALCFEESDTDARRGMVCVFAWPESLQAAWLTQEGIPLSMDMQIAWRRAFTGGMIYTFGGAYTVHI